MFQKAEETIAAFFDLDRQFGESFGAAGFTLDPGGAFTVIHLRVIDFTHFQRAIQS